MYLLLFCLEWLGLFAGTAKKSCRKIRQLSGAFSLFYKPMDIYFVSR
ncbi:hypothetical protein BQ1740_1208 [Bacillus subtilis]|nr:hypothetical protein BQ1740_1208 [Bacillus subtilis]